MHASSGHLRARKQSSLSPTTSALLDSFNNRVDDQLLIKQQMSYGVSRVNTTELRMQKTNTSPHKIERGPDLYPG